MSKPALSDRLLIRVERLIAIGAVAATAFGFTQPQVMSLAGLDFSPPKTIAARAIDTMPTGSLMPSAEIDRAKVHGLAGTLKSLRARD